MLSDKAVAFGASVWDSEEANEYGYMLLKGIKKVTGEAALIFLAYGLKRVISILGIATIMEEFRRIYSQKASIFLFFLHIKLN